MQNLYQLSYEEHVARAIERLPGTVRQRIVRILRELRQNPRPAYSIPLRNRFNNLYKISLDQYRIVYRIEDEIILITVLKVGKKHGPEFYQEID